MTVKLKKKRTLNKECVKKKLLGSKDLVLHWFPTSSNALPLFIMNLKVAWTYALLSLVHSMFSWAGCGKQELSTETGLKKKIIITLTKQKKAGYFLVFPPSALSLSISLSLSFSLCSHGLSLFLSLVSLLPHVFASRTIARLFCRSSLLRYSGKLETQHWKREKRRHKRQILLAWLIHVPPKKGKDSRFCTN